MEGADPMRTEFAQAELERLARRPLSEWIDTLLTWIIDEDKKRCDLAIAFFARFGEVGTAILLRRALSPDKVARHRIEMLKAIEKIGRPLQVEDWMDLQHVAKRYSPEVQQQIARVLKIHLHHPDTASQRQPAGARRQQHVAAFDRRQFLNQWPRRLAQSAGLHPA